jgi:predicted  nucleic acid-binding Zn-ribbon protein
MRCIWCSAMFDDIWRWCPDCGGPVFDRPEAVDLDHAPSDRYTVEWAARLVSAEHVGTA